MIDKYFNQLLSENFTGKKFNFSSKMLINPNYSVIMTTYGWRFLWSRCRNCTMDYGKKWNNKIVK